MDFSKELLFAVGFIVIVIIFIHFVSYRMLQKKIKGEVAKQFLIEKKKIYLNQQQVSNNNLNNNLDNNVDTNNKEDMETYDIDTPSENDIDSNADSYVNPLHSEKNVTDTDEE
jgi:uncharacterized membrane protein YhiD involved in acid resistance